MPMDLARYCSGCSKPYPWTARTLRAARELVEEQEALTDGERRQLADSIENVTRDTPFTAASAFRIKRLARKAGGPVLESLRELLVNVVSESVKQALLPRP